MGFLGFLFLLIVLVALFVVASLSSLLRGLYRFFFGSNDNNRGTERQQRASSYEDEWQDEPTEDGARRMRQFKQSAEVTDYEEVREE